MATISFNNLQAATPTSGAAVTLATVPTDHEYIGTIGLCYVATAGASTTASIALTTGGAATTASYRAYNVELDAGETLDYTVSLEAGKQIDVSSAVGDVSAQFNYQDRDNS